MKLPEDVILKQMELGPLANFLYFIGDKNSNKIAVVDPAWDVDYLCEEAEKSGYKITAILLTHAHPDHTNGFNAMVERYKVPAYISEHETEDYGKIPDYPLLKKVKNNEIITIGGIDLKCVHAPGHSPGCQLFLYKNVCIAGDAIFIDGCGRCDLPGSNPRKQYNTLQNIIGKLPDETILFTGHNYGRMPYDTVGNQKKTNPYLDCSTENEFLSERMGI